MKKKYTIEQIKEVFNKIKEEKYEKIERVSNETVELMEKTGKVEDKTKFLIMIDNFKEKALIEEVLNDIIEELEK
jgi:hypothetical protein